jgi:putative SOS response-associated peptidase YedK
MPVILNEADYDLWLDPAEQDPDRLQPLLRLYDTDRMLVDPVDRYANSPKNDDPKCIQYRS